MSFNKEKYLQRINCSANLKPNLDNLRKLQKHHLLNIPFENLDIHNNIPIKLSIENIFNKVVNQNRGGFCYELNGLFYELLNSIGFDVKMISARVFNQKNGYGKEYDHLAIISKIDDVEYLIDVGFGEFAFEPLKLQIGILQKDQRGNFIIDTFNNEYLKVCKIENEEITPQYIFKKEGKKLKEFKQMCIFHQTSVDSYFTSRRLITLPTVNGRVTISGNTLKIKKLDTTEEVILQDETEYERELWSRFKIKI